MRVIEDRSSLDMVIASGEIDVCCQTEILLGGQFVNPGDLNSLCRKYDCGYISSQTLGPWGYAFVDYGDRHIITDPDGEKTKTFYVLDIQKGK